MRLAFQVAYLGDRFFGSQIQLGYRTVEGEFIAACERMALFPNWREAGFSFAGRTDRGVHAYGQVCAFTTNAPDRAIQAMNFQLPRDCWCRGYAEVANTFHPRYSALSRTYRYFISDTNLDTRAMIHAANLFCRNSCRFTVVAEQ
jgi:tRNA pseudouridine38-40 synthase